jgi:hypothetical protein
MGTDETQIRRLRAFVFLPRFAKNDFMHSARNPATAGAPLFFSIIAKVFQFTVWREP